MSAAYTLCPYRHMHVARMLQRCSVAILLRLKYTVAYTAAATQPLYICCNSLPLLIGRIGSQKDTEKSLTSPSAAKSTTTRHSSASASLAHCNQVVRIACACHTWPNGALGCLQRQLQGANGCCVTPVYRKQQSSTPFHVIFFTCCSGLQPAPPLQACCTGAGGCGCPTGCQCWHHPCPPSTADPTQRNNSANLSLVLCSCAMQ